MRCGIRRIPEGNGCVQPGVQPGCTIWSYAWESLGLTGTSTDATIKFVPRYGTAYVLGFTVSMIAGVSATSAQGGGGPLVGTAIFLSALTSNTVSYLPQLSGSVGAALSNKYALASFAQERLDAAGGVLASLETGEGSPWPQFGIHKIPLSATGGDDVTVTIESQNAIATDIAGELIVLQIADESNGGNKPNGSVITSSASPR